MDELQRARVRRAGVGYCLVAPGVYLWDEDRREVERAARELRGGVKRPRPTQRMLVIPRQDVAAPARPESDSSCEAVRRFARRAPRYMPA